MKRALGKKALGKKSDIATARLQKDVLARLHHLRSAVKVIGHSYISRIEGQIIQIQEFSERSKKGKADSKVFIKMLSKLESLKMKPEKGRRKDLKKIESIISSISQAASKR